MIYFLQDPSDNAIKIGFTASDTPEGRIRACQTGNPRPLALLATIPGDEAAERGLHQTFTGDRLHGEWFRPSPAVLAFIIQAQTALAAKAASVPAPKTDRWPLTIYLAGKISREDWRNNVVCNDKVKTSEVSDEAMISREEWSVARQSIRGLHHYAGPYYADSNWASHSPYFGDDTHGLMANRNTAPYEAECEEYETPHGCATTGFACSPRAPLVHRLCASAIHASDLLYAWIDQPDCYGTIAEIGYAAALGKTIWIAGPKRYRDMWFVYEYANRVEFDWSNPENPIIRWLTQLEEKRAARGSL